ncbi:microcephalin isoform X2 [Echeneis naucrates]|uniref:microcephalin isoform X2 n=1 Tax=Echeneis naucrates TaxID=173247 RepID=UPI001113AB1A|nr:microcephalin isoform X2 [Echeneis naucrates]
MTTSNNCSFLKDVVAFVDVWSSDKTANYSKAFVQQLQEMGAQISKTFNKQVTHVVFSNGHLSTWKKAKKSDVKLVSVLWVVRCYDDGVRAEEELYPALNDESNPVLKNKKHRCMQPKDSPERTPENDKRMRKKLNKMMKDLPLKQHISTDVSPIIIDEENGIVYSPALKRSDYMAQRLKDMKEKRENISPTASQMVESCSPTGLKPFLGSTPTVVRLFNDQSDDNPSASVAEPGCSPDEEEGKIQVADHGHLEKHHRKGSERPWLSPCRNVQVDERISSPLKFPALEDKNDEECNLNKKLRSSVRKKPAEKPTTKDLLECPQQDMSNNAHNEKSSSPLPKKSKKGKQKMKASKSFTKTKTSICSTNVKSSDYFSSPSMPSDTAVKVSEETAIQSQKQNIHKQARLSYSALVQSFTQSNESQSVASVLTGDDDVFEDYFSPANHHQTSRRSLISNEDIPIPFDFESFLKKRKQRSESTGSESYTKKRKLEESQSRENFNQQSTVHSQPQQGDKESLSALDSLSASVTLKDKARQSTLSTIKTDAGTRRRTSTLVQQTVSSEDTTASHRQKNSESGGNECTVADGLTEILSDSKENHNRQTSLCLQKMVKTKVMRTLVMTSMPTEQQNTVVQVVKALGGFSIVDRVCENTTHVVSGGHRRTLNILFGIARGCWILSFEWILWCLEQRQWIPEEPYELSDRFPAAQICRLQRHLSAGEHQQDLFQDQPAIFVSQHSQPPSQSLVELIQLCGGRVCRTVRQAGICVGRYRGRRPEGTRILSEQWVLDSITHLKQLSYDDYDLE